MQYSLISMGSFQEIMHPATSRNSLGIVWSVSFKFLKSHSSQTSMGCPGKACLIRGFSSSQLEGHKGSVQISWRHLKVCCGTPEPFWVSKWVEACQVIMLCSSVSAAAVVGQYQTLNRFSSSPPYLQPLVSSLLTRETVRISSAATWTNRPAPVCVPVCVCDL